MTGEQFTHEKIYQAGVMILKAMLQKGLISEAEAYIGEKLLYEKYKPPLGSLYSKPT